MKTVSKEIGGRQLILEKGKLARQADGSVTVQYGETIVLVTVVHRGEAEVSDILPLNVEYREKTFAVGKIPGGFYKREGRPTTKEILTMRLIDRSLRPMFPEFYNHETQITAYVLSADQDNDPDIISITAASAATIMANIPLISPIASVRVGRIGNEFILNPSYKQLEESELDIVITGTSSAVVMVEGKAMEINEDTLLDAIFWGHRYIKDIIEMQLELLENVTPTPISQISISEVVNKIGEQFNSELVTALQEPGKIAREKNIQNLYEKIKLSLLPREGQGGEEDEWTLQKAFEKKQKELVRHWILEGKRIDGRGLKDIRPIVCEVGLLPRTHGSALFTRGETQAMVTATLGTSLDEQTIEGLLPEVSKPFMLHYNFPAFCVGEVKTARGPSRRDIGHGILAERSLEVVLPDEKRFPYTIRIVSEILESNGSSSMATVCGGTLAMMDAGVPIKRPVAGIAMGLVNEDGNIFVLSDIMGTEDHFGDMDFKVAGTQRGVTGFQMDIKIAGVTREILAKALEQAREGRIHILREMMAILDRPRREISSYAPRVFQMKVPPDKISLVIGPGGKTIRNMQDVTNAKIDVKDDGTVTIYCKSKDGAAQAKEMIEQLTEEVKVGNIYKGKVTSVKNFGAFVEIVPGMEGLVHVSELEKNYVQNVSDVVKVGDEISVKVLAIDEQNRIKLSKRAVEQSKPKSKQRE